MSARAFGNANINISIHQSLSIWTINIIKNASQVGGEAEFTFVK